MLAETVSGLCWRKMRIGDVGKTLLTAWSFFTVLKHQKKHDSMKHVEFEKEKEEVGGGERLDRAENNKFFPVCIGTVVKFVGCAGHDFQKDSRCTC